MLSTSCNLNRFFEALEDMDYFDVIYFAEQEATAAERLCYQIKGVPKTCDRDVTEYANILKGFINFMRYGVKPPRISDLDFELFRSACKKVVQGSHRHGRCLDYL